MATTVVKVGGMSCQGCVKSVTQVLQDLPGVATAEVSLERGEASVAHDESKVGKDAMVQAVNEAGFDAS